MNKVDADEYFVVPQPWKDALQYERDETVFKILQAFTNAIFSRDDLRLEERDETIISRTDSDRMHSLFIHGHVGYARRESFLYLIRSVRLRSICDVGSSVHFSCRKGDAVPHLAVEPLLPFGACRTCTAVRRWRVAYAGMRCGLLQRVAQNRQLLRQRIAMHLQQCTASEAETSMGEGETKDDYAMAGRVDGNRAAHAHTAVCDTVDGDEKGVNDTSECRSATCTEHDRHESPHCALWRFSSAKEKESNEAPRAMDLVHLTAAVPTLFVAWSNEHASCMQWLRQHIFTDLALQRLAKYPPRMIHIFAAPLGADPWLNLVERYVALPGPPQPSGTRRSRRGRTDTKSKNKHHHRAAGAANALAEPKDNTSCGAGAVPNDGTHTPRHTGNSGAHAGSVVKSAILTPLHTPPYKRAQIVLVSVDRDCLAAREAYANLLAHCKGWRSAFVDLVALWAGEEGLGSDYATVFDVYTLPHIMTSTPASRHPGTGRMLSARIAHIPYRPRSTTAREAGHDTDSESERSDPQRCGGVVGKHGVHDEEDYNNHNHAGVWGVVRRAPSAQRNTSSQQAMRNEKAHILVTTATTTTTTTAIEGHTHKASVPVSSPSSSSLAPHKICRCVPHDDRHWHRLPKARQVALTEAMRSFITSRNAPLRWRACTHRRFTMIDPTAAQASGKGVHACVRSTARLRGLVTTCDVASVASMMRELLQVSNFVFDGQMIHPSDGLATRLDAITPGHCALGMEHVLTCWRCRCNVHTNVTAYYRCIHCLQPRGVFCLSCVRDTRSPCEVDYHILLRVPPGVTRDAITPLLWGPGNVIPLPMHPAHRYDAKEQGNAAHEDAYCNVCQGAICDVRWKCAVCYDYDLCSACLADTAARTTDDDAMADAGDCSQALSPFHQPSHPLLRIPHVLGTGANGFLRPCIVDGLQTAVENKMCDDEPVKSSISNVH